MTEGLTYQQHAIDFGKWLMNQPHNTKLGVSMEGLYAKWRNQNRPKEKKKSKGYSAQMKERGQQIKAAIQLYCMENDIDLSPLQEYHIRLSKDDCDTLDIYPISGKWHNVTKNERGQIALDLVEELIIKHFNNPYNDTP